ncbi:hypothetical protein [Agromyces bauzanensis]
MGKLADALRDGRIAGAVVGVGVAALIGVGVTAAITTANAGPTVVVETSAPALTIDLTTTDANGLAAEQEAEAAAAVAARIAAEAEAARVAAEQAAAAEAERIAAEQATAEADTEPAPEEPAAGPVKCPPGSLANSGDGGNDTSCFPEECFHVILPDPNYPQCVTAFKP